MSIDFRLEHISLATRLWRCSVIAALLLVIMGWQNAPWAQQRNREERQQAKAAASQADAQSVRQSRKQDKAQNAAEKKQKAGADQVGWQLPAELLPLQRLSTVLGRPTDHSITVTVWSAEALRGYIEYGTATEGLIHRTAEQDFAATTPVEVLLDQLPANTRCNYRLRYRLTAQREEQVAATQSFHTQRAPGSGFTFELQGDSHPERRQQFDPALYAQTLSAVARDQPDFYIAMGDDFSVDTLRTVTRETVAARYELQRPFLSLVAQSSSLFLVNGNHEQAAAANLNDSADNVAVWAQTARNRLYPMPAPDGFYSGNVTPVAHIGLLRNYYAWTWGDALFVVIDPYWHSRGVVDNELGGKDDGRKSRNLWDVTLGDAQYQWLRHTLADSKARFKFVLAHHVLGTGRGGVELADSFEWGGKNKQGLNEFSRQRPGWEAPIHQLMVKYGVSIFFQGHDHVFAHQQLDGVVYQTLPEPADPNYALNYPQAYRSGDVLPSSGRVRVTVSPEQTQVQYLRSWLPKDQSVARKEGDVAFSYVVKPRR